METMARWQPELLSLPRCCPLYSNQETTNHTLVQTARYIVIALLKEMHTLRYTKARRVAGSDSISRLDVGPPVYNCCRDSAATRTEDRFRRGHVSY